VGINNIQKYKGIGRSWDNGLVWGGYAPKEKMGERGGEGGV